MTVEAGIRRAAMSDLPQIVAMLADDPLGAGREGSAEPLDPAYVEAFEAIDADPNQLLVVMTLGEEIVGTLQLSFLRGISRRGALRGQIEGVRIAADHRSSGLGRILVEWAVAECRARNCALVQLVTDRSRKDAHRFYERLGFEATHLGYKMPLADGHQAPG